MSLPDVPLRDSTSNSVPSEESANPPSADELKTHSLPRNATTVPSDSQLSNNTTTASGNGDRDESVARLNFQESPPSPVKDANANARMLGQSDVEVLNVNLGSQMSYPLQKLLSQPVRYEVDSDDVESLDSPHSAHFRHHGNMYHPHRPSRSDGHAYFVNTNQSNLPLSHMHQAQGFHGISHRNLDNMHLSNHISFNPVTGLGRSVRGSPGLPNVAVPPPLGGITIDIDV